MSKSKKRIKKRKQSTVKKPQLSIAKYKDEIIDCVKNNKVVIITGQTGSGKSTQVPIYLYENGFANNGMIACLHPKCVAAMTLSQRVSEEINSQVGDKVGYQVRFYHNKSPKTKIMFMTVGFLLRTLINESRVPHYSVIIVDEAHERCVQTDLILARMKDKLIKQSNLKLVIMSATLDIDSLKTYFNDCPVISITPKPDNVEVLYRPPKNQDYVAEIMVQVIEIVKKTTSGHILIFLPGEDKVRRCKKILKNHKDCKELNNCVLLAFFSSMDYEDKLKVFLDYKKRKVIISTNVAETSLTIDDVQFVIDSGYVKRVRFDNDTRIEHWATEYVSLAEAEQRKGRAGRTVNKAVTKPQCFRIYSESLVTESIRLAQEKKEVMVNEINREEDETAAGTQELNTRDGEENPNEEEISTNNDNIMEPEILGNETNKENEEKPVEAQGTHVKKKIMTEYPEPEILKANLSFMVLYMKSIKMPPVADVDFLTRPNKKAVDKCIQHLIDLSLLDENQLITKLGLEVSLIPLDPCLAKVVYIAAHFDQWEEVFIIASLISVATVLKNVKITSIFSSEHGDLFQFLNVYHELTSSCLKRSNIKPWCKANSINYSTLKYSLLVFDQLVRSVFVSNQIRLEGRWENSIKKCFLSGYFSNIAIRQVDVADNKAGTVYRTINGDIEGCIMPYSCLTPDSDLILFTSMKRTNDGKLWFRNCVSLNREMVMNFGIKKFHIKSKLWNSILQSIKNT